MKTMLRVIFLMITCAPFFSNGQCPNLDLGPDTLICSGTSIKLDAGNPGASYLWSDGTTSSEFETFFEGEYWVEVTLNSCTVRDTIFVQHGPVIYADFNYQQTTTCSPLIVEFDEISQACSGSIIEWAWNFGDGTTSDERDATHGYAAPGTYTVKLTVKKNTGATYSTQQDITVTGAVSPVVNLGSDISICQGEERTLNAGNPGATYLWNTGQTSRTIDVSSTGKYSVRVTLNGCISRDTVGATLVPILWNDFSSAKVSDCSPVKYQFTDKSTTCNGQITNWYWEFGDGQTSDQQNPEHAFYNSGQFNVRLTITDNNGNTSRRTRKVTVALTSISVDLGSDTTICVGNSIMLNASQPGSTYLWSTGETGSSILVGSVGDYSVAVSKNGCTAKDTIRINTAKSVEAKWTYTKDGDCLPVKVQFTDSSEAFCSQQITSWSWDFGDGTNSTLQHPLHEFNTADSFIVKLTTTVSNGAQASYVYKLGINNTLYTLDMPARMIVCKQDSFQLDAGLKDAQYTWTPAANLGSPTNARSMAKASVNGWYKVDAKKCMVDLSDSIFVVVDSMPKPLITQQQNSLRVKNGQSFEWYFEGNRVAGANKNFMRIDRSGYYSVRVSNANGCSAQSDQAFFVPLSGKEGEGEDLVIKCSPNPTPGPFNIVLSEIPARPLKFVLYDRYGRAIHTAFLKDHMTPVRVQSITRGLYFAETTINNKKRVIPVVVQ